MMHFNEANHQGIASGDIASFPLGTLTLEAYGSFAQASDVEQMMPDWYAASIIFDSAGLIAVELPRLKELGGELSIVTCPNLVTLKVAVASAPVRLTAVEIRHCGKEVYPSLHVRIG